MKKQTRQQRIAALALARLDTKDAGFSATDSVRESLDDDMTRLYLDTWVKPLLKLIASGEKIDSDMMRMLDNSLTKVEQKRRDAKLNGLEVK